MKKIRILIINARPHWEIGGMETYSYKLIKLIKSECKNCEIIEYSIYQTNTKRGCVREKLDIIHKNVYTKSLVYYFKTMKALRKIKINEFDLIVNNLGNLTTKALVEAKNVVHVQHGIPTWYDRKKTTKKSLYIKLLFDNFFLRLASPKINVLKDGRNIVFFTKHDNIYSNSTSNVYYIKLSIDAEKKAKRINKKGIIWVGRFHNQTKNLKSLNNIANKIKEKIRCIGAGEDKYILSSENIEFLGELEHAEVQELIANSRLLVLTSFYEGFSYALVEALSNGTPIIFYNSFPSSYFFSECEASISIEAFKENVMIEKIEQHLELNDSEIFKISQKAISFAEKHFSEKTFSDSWIKILNDIYNSKK